MTSQPTPTQGTNILAEDERMELSWEGKLIESEEEEYHAEFIATDDRLIFSLAGGHFKDIGFQHIESVEVMADIETETDGVDPDGIMGLGVVSVLVGIGWMATSGFSGLSVVGGLSLIGLGGYALWWGKKNYSRLQDEYEVTEHEVYNILLRTDATSPFAMPIYIKTRENVGPDLSRLVQEAK